MNISKIRSRVMTLGNKLAGRMSRKEAFEMAWFIVQNGAVRMAVKGVTFGSRQEAIRRLMAYRPDQVRAFIVPEPENPVDPNALAVMVGIQWGKGLYRLGYVPKEYTRLVGALPKQRAEIRFTGGDIYGARLKLAV